MGFCIVIYCNRISYNPLYRQILLSTETLFRFLDAQDLSNQPLPFLITKYPGTHLVPNACPFLKAFFKEQSISEIKLERLSVKLFVLICSVDRRCNFPLLHVGLLVGWTFGWLVCHNILKRQESYTFTPYRRTCHLLQLLGL